MKIKKTNIERIRITGKMKDFKKAHDYIVKNGYSTISSGAKRLDAITIDPEKFVMIAEREMLE